jgi:hypothetical protein
MFLVDLAANIQKKPLPQNAERAFRDSLPYPLLRRGVLGRRVFSCYFTIALIAGAPSTDTITIPFGSTMRALSDAGIELATV